MIKYQNKQLNNYNQKNTMTDEKKVEEKKVEEKKVTFYDPVVNANREIPVSLAKKYVAGLEKLKKQLTN